MMNANDYFAYFLVLEGVVALLQPAIHLHFADCIMESSSVNVGEQEVESAPIEKIDPKSPLWKYVTVVGKIPGGGSLIWICSECQKEFKASYTRVKAHLLGDKEQWHSSMHRST